ncbi:MAG: succinate--CoA ligase subunit alpha [bacterium]|nr:succinate--CoA ligase subunit alpha [bacterium]MDZ4299962.1 succinate--CoA ligase subunit alpha [Candidatus Sungbacteria bacterium]
MSILIDKKTRILIQGITGNEGARACREALAYGTKVLAGVTPGKGGQRVEGVPVYNTIAEAMRIHAAINTSLIVVPGVFVKDAALEAIHARIPLIVILTEHVPAADAALIVHTARRYGVRIVGPSSIGIISPGKAKIGSIGTAEIAHVFRPGPIGVISKSGGMTAEIAVVLGRAGFGQSTVVGIGGDLIIGSDFADLLVLYKDDPETRAIVLFGEVGGTYEERAAEYIAQARFKKPVVALIAGRFAEALSEETVLGHAGAIVARGRGSYASKIRALKKAGVHIASSVEEIPLILKRVMGRKK